MSSRELATLPSSPPRVVGVAIFLGTLVVALVLPLAYWFGADDLARWLNQEDGPYEMTGALATLAASLLILAACTASLAPPSNVSDSNRASSPREGRLFLWLLAFALLVMFGEEISWGQRIFAFATPDWMRRANIQREFNLHNLRMFHPELTSNRLKPLWMLGSFALLGLWPLVARRSARLQQWATRWGVPRPSAAIAWAAGATFAAYVIVTRWAVEHQNLPIGHGMGEAAETAFELLYLLLAIEVVRQRGRSSPRRIRRFALPLVGGLLLLTAAAMIAGNVRQQRRRAEALRALAKAQAAIEQSQFARAQSAAWRAVQLAPDTPEAHFYLGVALSQQGMLAEAAQAFETAVRLEPQAVVSQRNLAAVLIKQGRPQEAIRRLREALTIADDAPLRHLLGVALLKAGNRRAAEAEFQRALKLDPQYQPAQEELRRLRP